MYYNFYKHFGDLRYIVCSLEYGIGIYRYDRIALQLRDKSTLFAGIYANARSYKLYETTGKLENYESNYR